MSVNLSLTGLSIKSLTIICNRLCLWNTAPGLGKLLAKLVVDGHLTAVKIVDGRQPLFIHHQRVFHSQRKGQHSEEDGVGWTCLPDLQSL